MYNITESQARILRNSLLGLAFIFILSGAYFISESRVPKYSTLFFFTGCWMLPFLYDLQSENLRKKTYILLSATLLGISFPPYPCVFIFIALIPFFLLTDEHEKAKTKLSRRLVDYYILFLGFNIFASYWIANTTFGGSIFAFLVNSLLMTIVAASYSVLRQHLSQNLRPLFFIVAWISFEYLHYHWPLNWPWLTLGNTLSSIPWAIQWLEYTGVLGGTLWIITVNLALHRLCLLRTKGAAIYSGLWALVPIFLSLIISLSVESDHSAKPTIKVASVNPNFEPNFEFPALHPQEVTQRILDQIQPFSLDSIDLFVLPEGLVSRFNTSYPDRSPLYAALQDISKEYSTSFFVGASGYQIFDPEEVPQRATIRVFEEENTKTYWETYNNAVLIRPSGIPLIYNKKLMVPGAESFPFRKLLWFLEPLVVSIHGNWAGHGSYQRDEVFPIPNTSALAAPVICYEADFGEHCQNYIRRYANIFVSITEDGWWENTKGHSMHLYINRLRCIEYRRWMVRNANYGNNTFIDQHGKFKIQPTHYGEKSVVVHKIPLLSSLTFYARWGDVLGRMSVGIFIFCFSIGIVRAILEKSNNTNE